MAHWYYIGAQSEYDSFDLTQHQPNILWSSDGTQFVAEHLSDPADTTSYIDRQTAIAQCQILIDNPEPEDV